MLESFFFSLSKLIHRVTMLFVITGGLYYISTNPKAVIAIACVSMITLPLVYNKNYNVVTAKLKAMGESIARMW